MNTKKLLVVICTFIGTILSNAQDTNSVEYGGQDRYDEVMDSIFVHIPFDTIDLDYLLNRNFNILKSENFVDDYLTNIEVLQLQNTLNKVKKDNSIPDLTYFSDFITQDKRDENDEFSINVMLTEHNVPYLIEDSLALDSILTPSTDSLPMLKSGFTPHDIIGNLEVFQFALSKKKMVNDPYKSLTFNFSPSNNHNFTNKNYTYAIKIGDQSTFTDIDPRSAKVSYKLGYSAGKYLPITIQWKENGNVVAEKIQKIYLSKYQKIVASNVGNGVQGNNAQGSFEVTYKGHKATASYELACGETDFTKPIIYVEGFDITGDLGYSEAYSMVNEGFAFYHTYNPNNMDFIAIDFECPTCDLFINEELVKKVIREVNKRKWANGSTHQNFVIGHSMGGVLARMALRNMEIWNENHDASNYISIDAPHLGANVPPSLQFLLDDYINLSNASFNGLTWNVVFNALISSTASNVIVFYTLGLAPLLVEEYIPDIDALANDLYYGKASQQLALHRVWDSSTGENFRTYLSSIGYPQQTINSAIAHGNSTGNQVAGISPGSNIVHMVSSSFFHHIRIECFASQNGGGNYLLYENKISARMFFKWLFFGLVPQPWKTPIWHIKRRKNDYGTTLYAHDSGPGGRYPLGAFANSSSVADNFSFIPLASALGVSSQMTNPYWSFGSTDISSGSGTGDSPFMRTKNYQVSFGVNNHSHNSLFNSGSTFIQNLIGGIPSSIPSTLNTSFNFGTATNGQSTNSYIGSTTINSGVSLSIQKNIDIGYPGSSLPARDYHHFVLETERSCNGSPVNITFNSGSTLETGNGWGYTGDFIINPNATVRFKSGSTLRLRDKSQLIVRSGGRLIIEPNVNIILEGDNSVMRFMDYETLELTDGCIFKMDDKGHLAFHGGWDPNYPNSIIFGQNSKLELIGDSYNYDDKILELHGLWKISGDITNRVKLRKGYVTIDPSQHISVDVPVYFNRVLFTCSEANEKFSSVSLWGQKNILITSSKFHNAKTGLINHAGTSIHPLNVQNSQFLNCDEGISLQGGRASVRNSQFVYPMGVGIKGDGLVNDSEFEDNQFLGGVNIAMNLKGQTGSTVIAKENEVSSINGFLTQNINLNLRCNDFQTTLQCLLLNGGSLTMNDDGVNSFHNTTYNMPHILLNSVRYLATKNGENEFSSSYRYISGSLLPSALAVDFYSPTGGNPNNVVYQFDKNRYSSGKINITIPSYNIQIDHTNQPSTSVCPPDPIIINNIPQVSSTLPNITSTYFSNVSVTNAVQMAMEQTTNTVIPNPNEMACRYFIDILEYYPAISNRDLETLHRFSYDKMHETFNLAFANAEIPKNTVSTNTVLPDLLVEANTYINGQIALLQPSVPEEARQISKFIMDKAFLNRSAGFYHYAEMLLAQSENFEDLELLARSQYWSCLINAEQQLYYGMISEIEFLEMDKACNQAYNNAKMAQNAEDIEANEDYVAPSSESHFTVLRTLNGAEAISNKWVGNTVELLNSLGQRLETKSVDNQSTITFDLSTYSKGIYFISNGNKAEKVVW